MRKLYIKQKVFSFTDQFSVYDDQERRQYYVKGSFMKIPKQFTIYNHHDQEIAVITKKMQMLSLVQRSLIHKVTYKQSSKQRN